MVHQREGGGKISSPHSVKDFGDQKPAKMGSCDLNWIIILFSIHINVFGVEKVEDSAHVTIFTSGTSLAKRGLEPFGSVLRH